MTLQASGSLHVVHQVTQMSDDINSGQEQGLPRLLQPGCGDLRTNTVSERPGLSGAAGSSQASFLKEISPYWTPSVGQCVCHVAGDLVRALVAGSHCSHSVHLTLRVCFPKAKCLCPPAQTSKCGISQSHHLGQE